MERVKLGEICNIQSGGTPSRSKASYWEKGNIPWIKIGDFKGKHLSQVSEYITVDGLNHSSAKLIPKGSILYTIFATIGEVTILDVDATTNQAIAGLTLNDNRFTVEYLYYYLKSLKKEMSHVGRGVAQNNINLSILRNLMIPVLPKSEQLNICKTLQKTEKILEHKNLQLTDLDLLIKSRFVEIFGDPIYNEKEWKTSTFKNITYKIGSGATPKGGKEAYISQGISLIRSMNVYDADFHYKELAYITDIQAKKLDNVAVLSEDILFNITGASIARTCVVPNDVLPARVNQHVAIIRCNKEITNPYFINHLLINDSTKKALLNIGESGGATRQAITKEQIENFTVIIPPLELQNEFVAFVREIDKSRDAIQKSLDETKLLFDSLMQEYFG